MKPESQSRKDELPEQRKDPVSLAQSLRSGLLAWQAADEIIDRRAMTKAFRDNWDRRIGSVKFGGVWSIALAKANSDHPASVAALAIPRREWTGKNVTVEHAVPVGVLYEVFMAADTTDAMQQVIDAYSVAVVTKEEDARLRNLGIGSKMPFGWRLGDDPHVRWHSAGIEVHPNKSKVLR